MKNPGGLSIAAVLPVALCRTFGRRLLFCLPLGKCLFAIFTLIVFLNDRKQAPRKRFEDVFRNFGRIDTGLNIGFFCVHLVPPLSLL